MQSNIRPLALTARQAQQLKACARQVFDRALEQVTRGVPEAEARAVRHELALHLYRLAIQELDDEAPDDEGGEFDEDTVPGLAKGTPTNGKIPGLVTAADMARSCARCGREISVLVGPRFVDHEIGEVCGTCAVWGVEG